MKNEFDEFDELLGADHRRNRNKNRGRNQRKSQNQNRNGIEGKERLQKPKQSVFSLILMGICVLVFVFAAIQLYNIYAEYRDGADEYEEVIETAVKVPEIDEEEVEQEISYEEYYVDFDILTEQNAEVVAWIRFDSPEIINYPVVQTTNNDTYLSTTFLGESNIVGAIFVDADNSSDFSDDNTIIYGHNMKDTSMFGELKDYVDEEYYQEYPYFYVYTPDGKASKYQVAAAEEINASDSNRYSINFSDSISFQSYINIMIQNSYYDTNAPLDTDSKLITLSTCTSSDDRRFIVQGVKIEEKDMVEQ